MKLKNILIIGSGPLPKDKSGIQEAGGLRTKQFFDVIKQEGYKGVLICIQNSGKITEKVSIDKWTIYKESRYRKDLIRQCRQIMSTMSIDIVVGVNTFPSFIASKICPSNVPLWTDLNGWIMAEAQARSFSDNTNVHFANAFRQEKFILSKADKISTVSERQKYVTIGELSTLGYLQKSNFLEDKVFSIPNYRKFLESRHVDNSSISIDKKSRHIDNKRRHVDNFKNNENINKLDNIDNADRVKKLLIALRKDKSAFLIGWIGGYNNWVDEETLFKAVDSVMSNMSNVYFVSTGGNIKNVSNKVFSKFKTRIDKSKNKDKFIFLGWVKSEEIPIIYDYIDIGINVDFKCIETETGARNRINEMLAYGIPVLTTGGSEIANAVKFYNAGITVKNGDSEILAYGIKKMVNLSLEERYVYIKNTKKICNEIFEINKIMYPLISFLKNPKKENIKPLKLNSFIFFIKNIYWYFKNTGIKNFFKKIYQNIF
jgi:glycosyltransferase involved in cell wall biosynthesis